MPQDIVVGQDASDVAAFLAKYSGRKAPKTGPTVAMLDLKAIRRDPEPVRAALARRRDGSEATLDRVLELDARRRELLPETEALRARQNEASAAIGRAKKEGRDASEEIAAMQDVARRVKTLGEDGSRASRRTLDEALMALPNPPDPTAADEDTTIREVGEAGASGPRPPRARGRR